MKSSSWFQTGKLYRVKRGLEIEGALSISDALSGSGVRTWSERGDVIMIVRTQILTSRELMLFCYISSSGKVLYSKYCEDPGVLPFDFEKLTTG